MRDGVALDHCLCAEVAKPECVRSVKGDFRDYGGLPKLQPRSLQCGDEMHSSSGPKWPAPALKAPQLCPGILLVLLRVHKLLGRNVDAGEAALFVGAEQAGSAAASRRCQRSFELNQIAG